MSEFIHFHVLVLPIFVYYRCYMLSTMTMILYYLSYMYWKNKKLLLLDQIFGRFAILTLNLISCNPYYTLGTIVAFASYARGNYILNTTGQMQTAYWSLNHIIGSSMNVYFYTDMFKDMSTVLSNTMLSLYISPLYLLAIPFVYLYTNKIKPVIPMLVYNFIQVAVNTCVWVPLLITMVPQSTGPFMINVPSNNAIIQRATYVHYLTKYLDLFDTLFIALSKNKRQLSFLHVYHHASIVVVWDLLVSHGVNDGTIGTPALVNSFVHTVMYSHYLIQSFGYKNPFKVWVTRVQLMQFVYLFFQSIAMIHHETVMPKYYGYIQLVYQVQMLFLFGNFYIDTYYQSRLGPSIASHINK